MSDSGPWRAPSLDDIAVIAQRAFSGLPNSFRRLCEGVVIQVADFPDDETLEEMNAETEFDLLGLFRGRGLAQSGAGPATGTPPNMIWLYRRPLLDYWCDGEDTLEEVVAHVVIHEIGHHFGLSDADMEAIESARFLAKPGATPAFTTPSSSGYTVGQGPDRLRCANPWRNGAPLDGSCACGFAGHLPGAGAQC